MTEDTSKTRYVIFHNPDFTWQNGVDFREELEAFAQ